MSVHVFVYYSLIITLVLSLTFDLDRTHLLYIRSVPKETQLSETFPLYLSRKIITRHKTNGKPCDLSFPTYHQLMTHKNRMGHKQNRKRKAEEVVQKEAETEKRRTTGQAKIKGFFATRERRDERENEIETM